MIREVINDEPELLGAETTRGRIASAHASNSRNEANAYDFQDWLMRPVLREKLRSKAIEL